RLRSMCIWVTVARVRTRAIATAESTMESTSVLPASGEYPREELRRESVPPRSMSPSESVDRRDRVSAHGDRGRDPVDDEVGQEGKGDVDVDLDMHGPTGGEARGLRARHCQYLARGDVDPMVGEGQRGREEGVALGGQLRVGA